MNLDQARQAVTDRGFDYLAPNRLTLMLNTGKDEFEDLYEWPWLQKPFTGPTPLALPDLKLVMTVASGGAELFGLDLRQVAEGGSDLALKGSPRYWWLNGSGELHAWPGDGADVHGVYIADSPPLVNPNDTPLIPVRYHPLWIDFAVCEAYKDSDNFSASQMLRSDVLTRMQDVITRYETRNRQHSPFMSVRQPSGDE